MYGMVNRAVEELVVARFGHARWLEIRDRAGVDVEEFVSSEGYDDKITYDLVAAGSEVLGLTPEQILEAFGEHWVLETAAKGYDHLLAAAGSTLPEFLDNLPDFHSRIMLMMPKLEPPEFRVSEREDDSLVLHYHSHRPGLQPFVIGLIKGLAKRFDTDVEVELRAGRHTGLEHDEFLIRWPVAAEG